MKVDQVRDSVSCRVDEVRYFVKIVDVVRVDQVRVDQVGCSPVMSRWGDVGCFLMGAALKEIPLSSQINVTGCIPKFKSIFGLLLCMLL